jgi:AraC-like DNA-binding protein
MDDLTQMKAEGFVGQRLYRLPAKALERVRQRPFTKDFIVTDLGYFPTVDSHSVERKNGAEQWILIFVNEGQGWYRTNNQKYSLESNEVLLIPPGHAHAYGADSARPWSIFWFHFEGEGIEQLLEWITPKDGLDSMPCRSPDSLRRQFHSILSAVERGYHEHTLLELSRVLIHTLTLLHRNPHRRPREQQAERIESAMNQIREDIGQPQSLQHYAEASGLSVSQFSYLFKQHTGLSPMSYQSEVRMQRACELLDTTEDSIKSIARQLGYEDPLYFSRAFRKCTGLSPSQYRDKV